MRIEPRPIVRIAFLMPDGTVLMRDWMMGLKPGSLTEFEIEDGCPVKPRENFPVPDWLTEPHRAWDHPQDPITMSGIVKPGHEADAEKLLGVR